MKESIIITTTNNIFPQVGQYISMQNRQKILQIIIGKNPSPTSDIDKTLEKSL